MPVRTKSAAIKFEIQRSSVGGITLVVCSLFLWAFIMGVWVGQSILAPPVAKKSVISTEVTENMPENKDKKGTDSLSASEYFRKQYGNSEKDGGNGDALHIQARKKIIKNAP